MAELRPGGPAPDPSFATARVRLPAALACGAPAALASAFLLPWTATVLVGWSTTALVFLLWVWLNVWTADADRTRAIAVREDSSRATADLVLILASLASLVGVALVLLQASNTRGAAEAALTGLAASAVVLSWLSVHTVYTLRYAHLYWSGERGVDFNQPHDPDYRDFAYLAFTVGMTYQVSDTNVGDRAIRRAILRQALLSYIFGTVIVAMTINVVAGLAR